MKITQEIRDTYQQEQGMVEKSKEFRSLGSEIYIKKDMPSPKPRSSIKMISQYVWDDEDFQP